MIFADKLIRLRKMNGWSQEELAARMNVSRQAVSKWEGAQTTPDLEKLLQLSALFGVTTDYLLKDELESEEFTQDPALETGRLVTLEDAQTYLALRRTASVRIALATFLCILAPIPLLLLVVMTETPHSGVTEAVAVSCGLIVLFLLVAAAAAVFIHTGFRNGPYEFLDKEPFETTYGVTGMVRERQAAYRRAYAWSNILGTCLCILSPIPLLLGSFTGDPVAAVCFLVLTMLLAGIGVMCFIVAGIRWAAMQRLLREGEFSPAGKRRTKIQDAVGTAYWLLAVAIYLGWSFLTDDWHMTWLIWPVAGVLYAGLMALCGLFENEKK